MLEIGQKASLAKTISESDVYTFAGLSMDFNSVHVNKVVATESPFGKRIVHGMLAASLISAVLGTRFPGDGTIYLEQDIKFMHPVYYDDTLTAMVCVSEIINPEKGIYKLNTYVINQDGKTVIDGFAVIKFKEKIHG